MRIERQNADRLPGTGRPIRSVRSTKNGKRIKKTCALFLVVLMIVSVIGHIPADTQAKTDLTDATFLYMALDGSDENDGSKEKPFATLQAAVLAARNYEGTVVINIREGWYPIEYTTMLTAADTDLVIRAYPGEEVTFGGGIEVPLADLEYVTDEKILNRIIDEEARKHIRHINLSEYGMTYFGEMRVNGSECSADNGYPGSLSYNGNILRIAEYPNVDQYGNTLEPEQVAWPWISEFINVSGYRNPGNLREFVYKLNLQVWDGEDGQETNTSKMVEFDRYQYWTEADDIWQVGYLTTQWADSVVPVKSISEDGIITGYCGNYTPVSGANGRVRFIHLLEEIDVPGEYYVDYKTGDLYVYAPEGMGEDEVFEYVTSEKNFIELGGSKNVTIENLTITGSRGTYMIYAKNCDGVVINNCDISNTGDYAVYFYQCYNCGVQNSYLHDLNRCGIGFYSCGNRANLVSGNCFAVNCEIARFSLYRRCYAPAVDMNQDMGTYVAHNKIYGSSHQAMSFYSNDNIMEYNDISEVCMHTNDAGAIYMVGRNFSLWGNVIQYNYIHDCPRGVSSIYLDDMSSGSKVYGNVFYNAGTSLATNGGRNNTFENNLQIECGKGSGASGSTSLGMNSAGTSWAYSHVINGLKGGGIDITSDAWLSHYPAVKGLADDQPELPKNCVVRNNFRFNTTEYSLTSEIIQFGTYENNVALTFENGTFTEFFGENYTRVAAYFKDFDVSEWENIGLMDYTYEDVWKEKSGAVYDQLTEDERKELKKIQETGKATQGTGTTTGGTTMGGTTSAGSSSGEKTTGNLESVYSNNPNAPVSLFINDLKNLNEQGHIASAEWVEEGYMHIIPSSYDPRYSPFSDVTGARYLAIKYRAGNAEGTDIQFYMDSIDDQAFGDESSMKQDVISDGEWHIAIFDTQPLIDAGIYDGSYVSFFRLDPLECDYILDADGNRQHDAEGNFLRNAMPEGAYVDIAYVAFFDDPEKVEKYDPYTIPVAFFDAENIAGWEIGRAISSAELVDDYVHIVPSDGDPVYQPINNFAGDRYVAIKYRSTTAVGLDVEVYVSSEGVRPWDESTMLSSEIIADGEWHLAIINTQALIDAGLYDGVNVSFLRLDPVTKLIWDEDGSYLDENGKYYGHESLPEGAYIDIAYVAFFRTEEAANEFDANRTAE